MNSTFIIAFKSTVDKVGVDLATSMDRVSFIDLDDIVTSAELFKSNKNAIVWEFLTLDESPTDPLYSFSFRIGARTVRDIANYNILRMLDKVKEVFPSRDQIDVRDYSGAEVGDKVGTMYISRVDIDPQQFDKQSGIRMILVSGKAVRYG